MQHCVSFGTIAEYKALEKHELDEDAEDERNVDENARGHLLPDVGRWEDELGENNP